MTTTSIRSARIVGTLLLNSPFFIYYNLVFALSEEVCCEVVIVGVANKPSFGEGAGFVAVDFESSEVTELLSVKFTVIGVLFFRSTIALLSKVGGIEITRTFVFSLRDDIWIL